LISYYTGERLKEYRDEGDATLRAHEVFSEFLQHLVYFISHNLQNSHELSFSDELIKKLIQHESFFHVHRQAGKNQKITVWIDPKEQTNALISLSRNDSKGDNTQALLNLSQRVLGAENIEGFTNFISHRDKDGYSSLNTASRAGHEKVVKLLLDTAARA